MGKTIERGLEVLELLAKLDEPVRLADVVRETRLNKSTCYRLLMTLTEMGYVHKHPREATYSLGYKLFALGRRPIQLRSTIRHASFFIRRLAYDIGLNVQLAAIEGPQIVFLDKVEPPESPPVFATPGMRLDAHSCAAGKAILMYRAPEDIRAMYVYNKLTPHTTNTIRTVEGLISELKSSRARGYATELGEMIPGMNGIGAPVINSINTAVVSISTIGSNAILDEKQRSRIGNKLRETAEEISEYIMKRDG